MTAPAGRGAAGDVAGAADSTGIERASSLRDGRKKSSSESVIVFFRPGTITSRSSERTLVSLPATVCSR